jgi:coenzyme F420 hydrogenase subunit delta
MEQPLYQKECLIFGCGNPLFGDDGFGPAVIAHLEKAHLLSERVAAVDAGTSIRDILFDILLSPVKPRRIIVVDAVDLPGRQPGEIFEIDMDQIEPVKAADFSLHQFPTTTLLKEIRDQSAVEVRVLVAQIAEVPAAVRPGLSAALQGAIAPMGSLIMAAAASFSGSGGRKPAEDPEN